jgi:hypothetical protein
MNDEIKRLIEQGQRAATRGEAALGGLGSVTDPDEAKRRRVDALCEFGELQFVLSELARATDPARAGEKPGQFQRMGDFTVAATHPPAKK